MLYIKASAKPGARPTSAIGRWRGRKKSGDLKTDVDATRIKTRCSARDGASQLAMAVLSNTKIEVFNEIPVKEMRANSLTELNLKNKHIGVEGGMVLAGLIPVMPSLTLVR